MSAQPSRKAKLENFAANVENQSVCTCLMGHSLSAAARGMIGESEERGWITTGDFKDALSQKAVIHAELYGIIYQ